MAQFFDTSFAVDPETGANQRSFVGVSGTSGTTAPNLMKTHVCRNSYMRHFRPEVWGRVHHSEIHHLFEQHMLSKSQRKTRPTLQIISMSPLFS
jgi:hypothetical protein